MLEELNGETPQAVEPETQAEESAPPVEDTNQEQAPAQDNAVQKRINKITADKHTERRRAELAEAKIAELQAQQVTAPEAEAPPTEDQFDYDHEAFKAAERDYVIKAATRDAAALLRDEQAAQTVKQTRAQTAKEWDKKVEEFGKEDFDEVVGQLGGMFSADLEDAIRTAPEGTAIAYHLANHLELADELSQMTPMQAAVRLGQISANLSSGKTKAPTRAPNPIGTVGNGGGAVSVADADLTMEEYFKKHG